MKKLAARLQSSVFGGTAVRDMAQDDFAPITKEFYPGLQKALGDFRQTCVCVHRCNFRPDDRASFLKIASAHASSVVLVVPDTDPLSLTMLYVGLRGVLEDARAAHPTLGTASRMPPSQLLTIAGSFWSGCVSVQPQREPGVKVIPVRMTRSCVPEDIVRVLRPFEALFTKNKPFSIKAFPPELDVETLVTVLRTGPEIRRPVDEIVDDIMAQLLALSPSVAPRKPPVSTPVLYVSLAVSVQQDLVALAKSHGFVPPRLGKATLQQSADHITVLFKPTVEDVEKTYRPHLNRRFNVRVKQIVALADGTLVTASVDVEDFLHPLDHPHITLYWLASKRKPSQSKDMLMGNLGVVETLDVSKTITASLQFVYAS
jgi:hypothetical protein